MVVVLLCDTYFLACTGYAVFSKVYLGHLVIYLALSTRAEMQKSGDNICAICLVSEIYFLHIFVPMLVGSRVMQVFDDGCITQVLNGGRVTQALDGGRITQVLHGDRVTQDFDGSRVRNIV